MWVAAIGVLGFPMAAAAIGIVMALTLWVLADRVFAQTPATMGSQPELTPLETPARATFPNARPLPGPLLWRNRRFLTLCAGMALGLFAQIGMTAHLYSLLAPALGAQQAGLAMSLITVLAMATRTALGFLMPAETDRRLIACA